MSRQYLFFIFILLISENNGQHHGRLRSIDFEVFGHVQQVQFRERTKVQAKILRIRGWCQNTNYGTVIGTIQGEPLNIQNMISWLRDVGSPGSRIEKLALKNDRFLDNFSYQNFSIIV